MHFDLLSIIYTLMGAVGLAWLGLHSFQVGLTAGRIWSRGKAVQMLVYLAGVFVWLILAIIDTGRPGSPSIVVWFCGYVGVPLIAFPAYWTGRAIRQAKERRKT